MKREPESIPGLQTTGTGYGQAELTLAAINHISTDRRGAGGGDLQPGNQRFEQGMPAVAAHVALAGTVVFFAYRAVLTLQETLLFDSVANTPLQTPLWIPQGLWVAGLVLFGLSAVLQAARGLVMLVRHPQDIESAYGCASTRDEVETFLSDADRSGGRP